ncbi:ABC transporter substrate-binding protein [Methanooceanicella nereidis]|uniref:ABC transporter substrate-binding protein n=1 Tax=Methanooceanicella nereidis TaxID=2052831 RepID=UPI001E33CE44
MLVSCVSGCTQPTPTTGPDEGKDGQGITVIDSKGNMINLSEPARRIIVTNSDAAEVLIAIGAKDTIIGVSNTVKNNPLLSGLLADVEDIGDWQNPNMEKIVQLQPDVVIVYSSWQPKNIDQFEAANITIVASDCYKMYTLTSDIKSMGVLTGKEEKANEFAKFLDDNMELVRVRTANITEAEKPDVYWEQNAAYSTAGNGSGGDTLVIMAGGINIAGGESGSYPKVSAEWVLDKNPDVIIKTASTTTASIENMTLIRNDLMGREGMPKVDAVKNDRVYVGSQAIMFGPKGVVGLLYTAKIIHPDLFADVDPVKVLDEYAQKYVDGANKGAFIYPNP